ncbi:hypothetical protein EPI10_024546 [Gossypium australe]|uniref:Uncharacterized protein n=1 Tax=Gossypium australe TaxID=47621 RepID=A0A5B6VX99_9ROSI|nr:hypothetical protein EPI10_024546 [Gossypium australe]
MHEWSVLASTLLNIFVEDPLPRGNKHKNQPPVLGNLPPRGNQLFDKVNNNNLEYLPPPPNMARNERTLT